MVMLKSLLFVAATASALAIIPRDAKAVLDNLAKIDTDTKGLGDAVKNWDGSLFGALPIQSAEGTLNDDVKSATTEAQGESALSSDDSKSVVTYLNGTLGADASAALDTLKSRKADADSAGITSQVHDGLAGLKTNIDGLAAALVTITSDDQKDSANSVVALIDGYFQAAIDAFGS